jgi:hypothetical protein
MLGVFREDPRTREEFLCLIRKWTSLLYAHETWITYSAQIQLLKDDTLG